MSVEGEDLGLLGRYGVVIVPPSQSTGEWFVTLASWDAEGQSYVTGTDGPIVSDRQEALEQANRVLDWLERQEDGEDLQRVWERMQRHITTQEGLMPEPRSFQFPWER